MNAKGTKGTSGDNRKVLTSGLYDHYLGEFMSNANHILKNSSILLNANYTSIKLIKNIKMLFERKKIYKIIMFLRCL